MTQDEIIAMAREAGMGNALGSVDGLDELASFAALTAAHLCVEVWRSENANNRRLEGVTR